ncbi:MAG: hypothetical protein E7013_05280 [Alphaproteobacteria bacterium]|nr:hypothetical protein [Alphaproteobacteria bacterium]
MKKSLLIALLFCLLSTPCWANVIIPVFILFPVVIQSTLFGLSWKDVFYLFDFCREFHSCDYSDYIQPLIYGLIGLVLLWIVVQTEYLYLSKVLSELDKKTLKKQIWKANIFSTAIGFLFWMPLALEPYALTEYIFVGPIATTPFLTGSYWETKNFIIIILNLMALLYVCFKLSHWTEAPFLRKIRGNYNKEQVNLAVKRANRRSYWWLVLAILLAPFGTIIVFLCVLIRTFLNWKRQRKKH